MNQVNKEGGITEAFIHGVQGRWGDRLRGSGSQSTGLAEGHCDPPGGDDSPKQVTGGQSNGTGCDLRDMQGVEEIKPKLKVVSKQTELPQLGISS